MKHKKSLSTGGDEGRNEPFIKLVNNLQVHIRSPEIQSSIRFMRSAILYFFISCQSKFIFLFLKSPNKPEHMFVNQIKSSMSNKLIQMSVVFLSTLSITWRTKNK